MSFHKHPNPDNLIEHALLCSSLISINISNICIYFVGGIHQDSPFATTVTTYAQPEMLADFHNAIRHVLPRVKLSRALDKMVFKTSVQYKGS